MFIKPSGLMYMYDNLRCHPNARKTNPFLTATNKLDIMITRWLTNMVIKLGKKSVLFIVYTSTCT